MSTVELLFRVCESVHMRQRSFRFGVAVPLIRLAEAGSALEETHRLAVVDSWKQKLEMV